MNGPAPAGAVERPLDAMARVLRAVAGLVLLATALWGLGELLPTSDALLAFGRDWLPADRLDALLLFVVTGALLTAAGLPRQSAALLGGYLFGTITGIALTLLATTLGAALACQLARALGRSRLERHLPALVRTIDLWGGERVFARTLALRLFPLGSNLLTNLAAGVARVRRGPFLAASLLGFVPQTLVFGIAGGGVGASSPAALAFAALLLVLSIGIGVGFGRAPRHRRAGQSP